MRQEHRNIALRRQLLILALVLIYLLFCRNLKKNEKFFSGSFELQVDIFHLFFIGIFLKKYFKRTLTAPKRETKISGPESSEHCNLLYYPVNRIGISLMRTLQICF